MTTSSTKANDCTSDAMLWLKCYHMLFSDDFSFVLRRNTRSTERAGSGYSLRQGGVLLHGFQTFPLEPSTSLVLIPLGYFMYFFHCKHLKHHCYNHLDSATALLSSVNKWINGASLSTLKTSRGMGQNLSVTETWFQYPAVQTHTHTHTYANFSWFYWQFLRLFFSHTMRWNYHHRITKYIKLHPQSTWIPVCHTWTTMSLHSGFPNTCSCHIYLI